MVSDQSFFADPSVGHTKSPNPSFPHPLCAAGPPQKRGRRASASNLRGPHRPPRSGSAPTYPPGRCPAATVSLPKARGPHRERAALFGGRLCVFFRSILVSVWLLSCLSFRVSVCERFLVFGGPAGLLFFVLPIEFFYPCLDPRESIRSGVGVSGSRVGVGRCISGGGG